jgi:flavin-binding protein dodecin
LEEKEQEDEEKNRNQPGEIVSNITFKFPHIKIEFMAVLKVIELLASSEKSWEDAAQNAVKQASKTVKGLRSVYVKEMTAVINGNQITEYRVNVKVSFEILN